MFLVFRGAGGIWFYLNTPPRTNTTNSPLLMTSWFLVAYSGAPSCNHLVFNNFGLLSETHLGRCKFPALLGWKGGRVGAAVAVVAVAVVAVAHSAAHLVVLRIT
jgi:hypothetical protein